ncbi:MAG: hypothetical protein JNL57_11020 [Bacteroidetes bacterium]|nr:hypothetical protein [Bacteroidota bacterium]
MCFQACEKKKNKDPVTIIYKLGEVKDYMYFKKGTWWVYEHDKTHELDSQYVTSSYIGTSITQGREEWSSHITLQQEVMSMRIRSNFVDGWGSNNYFDIYTTGQLVDAYPYPSRVYQLERSKISSIGQNVPSTVFYHPFDLCPKKNCLYFYDSLFTNYNLNGNYYDTVISFAITYGEAVMQEPSLRTYGGNAKCYYAKNVGLIRVYQKTTTANNLPLIHNWNLVRKHIIQ